MAPFSPCSVPNPFRGAVVVSHTVPALNIVDFADPANRSIVETTRQELTGDWRVYRPPHNAPAPTQALALVVHRIHASVQGILAPSARNPSVNNLIVFYHRVLTGSVASE